MLKPMTTISVLAATALGITAHSSSSVQFDPIQVGMDKLQAYGGIAPPAGYTVEFGSTAGQPENTIAFTDNVNMTITLDTEKFENFEARIEDTAEFASAVAVVLYHEYQHTPDYGSGAVSASPCEHIEISHDSAGFACWLAGQVAAEGEDTAGICSFQNDEQNKANDSVEYHNYWCSGSDLDPVECEACHGD